MKAPTMTEPAIGYRRVSTETQLDGYGLELQTDAIAELVATDGLELVATFTDEGICGAEGLDVREALAAALDHLAEHPGTILIVPRLDRLARDLMVQEQVLADCWATGATVLSCSPTERVYCQPDNPEDPARTLIRQVLGAVAAYERAMIRLRMSKGRRRRLRQTGWAGGPTPFGWDDPAEQATLDEVSTQRATGASWATVAANLNERGLFKRNGNRWSRQELHQVHTKAAERGLLAS
jgi:DNA invertase Pin-like site-specific DNA recombinase